MLLTNNKIYKLIMLTFISIMILFSSAFISNKAMAFTKSDPYSSFRCFKSGWFWIFITDEQHPDSKIKVYLSRETAPKYNDVFIGPTKWNIEVHSDSTNNHNFKISSTTINTSKDINNDYLILRINFTYELEAHSVCSGSVERKNKEPDTKFSFTDYNKDVSSVKENGTHSKSKRSVTGTAYVNLTQTGLITDADNKCRYNGSELQFNVKRYQYKLNTKHWLEGFSKADLNKNLLNTSPASASSTLKSLVLQQSNVYKTYDCCKDIIIRQSPYGLSPGIPRGFTQRDKMYNNVTKKSTPLGTVNIGQANLGISLYYTPISYSITYNLDGGTNNSANPQKYNIIYPVTFSNPSKVGYQFSGWYNGSTKVTGINQNIKNSTLTTENAYKEFGKRDYGNKTITAKWNPNDYKVTFNPNGGNGSMAIQSFKYDTAQALTKNAFTRYKYTFEGWNTKADGSGVTYKDQQSVKNLTSTQNGNVNLYAKWKPNEPPVITCPIVNNKDGNEIEPFIKDDKLVIQKNDKFTAKYYATANDYEDGDITESIKILKNIPLEDGRATKSGVYDVTYEARDSYNEVVTKTMKVQVNDPPTCIVYDRFMFSQMNNVSLEKLLEQVMIDDKEDGFVRPTKIEIQMIDDKIIEGEISLDELLKEKSEHKIVVKVTDSLKGIDKNTFKLNVVDDIQQINKKIKTYPRFIDKNSIESLEPTSIWRTDSNYFNALINSLNNETPIKSYDLN